jgi:hypothetical protein
MTEKRSRSVWRLLAIGRRSSLRRLGSDDGVGADGCKVKARPAERGEGDFSLAASRLHKPRPFNPKAWSGPRAQQPYRIWGKDHRSATPGRDERRQSRSESRRS